MFIDLVDAKRIIVFIKNYIQREVRILRHLGGHENIVEIVDLFAQPYVFIIRLFRELNVLKIYI